MVMVYSETFRLARRFLANGARATLLLVNTLVLSLFESVSIHYCPLMVTRFLLFTERSVMRSTTWAGMRRGTT
jgi:hypothetical protein